MLLRLISRLPLPVLYVLCGAIAWLMRVGGWRRALVDNGLARCLPEKTVEERAAIARDFYRGLGRLVAEILRGSRMSADELDHRLRFENDAVVRDALAQGRRVLLLAGHHCNAGPAQLLHENHQPRQSQHQVRKRGEEAFGFREQ